MSRRVTYVRLHSNAYIPSVGDIGSTLPPAGKTLEGLVMETHENSINISFTFRGLKKELLIPFGNVILAELAPEDVKLKPLKAV